MSQRSRVQDTNIRNASTPQLPPALNSRSINSAVDAILDLHERRQAKRRRYSSLPPQDDDINVDSHSPILDEFVRTRSISIVADLKNFSLAEFGILWSEIRQYIQRHWNVGPGCKNKTTPKDMLFMALTFLMHGGSWDVIAALFKLKSSTFSKSITGFIRTIHPHLMQGFVTAVAEKWSMLRLVTTGHQFQNFPHARYTVDCTFQQTHIPLGSFGSKKSYFSKKHGLYGVKIEVSVLPNGFAIGVTPCAKGSVADIAVFESNEDFHRSQLAKQNDESNIRDDGPLVEIFSNQWIVLADKGYQGLANRLRAVTPVKRLPGSILSMEHEQLNADIATDRVIVENYFGRLKTLWSVANDIYSWKRENYDMFIQTCIALTNVHIRFLPLRSDDGQNYNQYINRLMAIGAKMVEKRASTTQKYLRKRKPRLDSIIPNLENAYDDGDSDNSALGDDSGIFD
ncbi:hypothetical protein Ae201684P_001162 [Aphanomyces euteiches]|uniref:DDE Tnp4 domain-containing protein n=1 Tax=Aphanomyces euteiches TaxID=100861 RepID=A0A6G0WGQ2_9STRA|nr:hypothetical protein Ae201684_015426 [Aphanomyces euteiches]KAH9097686.1 hypothetical protein Ae201684P_001162 [Aphanomyces euteiches]KAH9152035.1 hypothetical protein AeRB84_005458 [Aphanomyces euteiches]